MFDILPNALTYSLPDCFLSQSLMYYSVNQFATFTLALFSFITLSSLCVCVCVRVGVSAIYV